MDFYLSSSYLFEFNKIKKADLEQKTALHNVGDEWSKRLISNKFNSNNNYQNNNNNNYNNNYNLK